MFTDGNPYSGSTFVPTPIQVNLQEDIYEPNDSRATAPTVPLVLWNNELTMDSDGDDDYYRFELTAPTNLVASIKFTHAMGNLNLQLQDSVGTVLAGSASTTDNEKLEKIVPAGTYYLRVYGWGTGNCNRYLLWIINANPNCGLGFELVLLLPALMGLRSRTLRRSTAS